MQHSENRRDRRFPVRIEATLVRGKQSTQVATEDVGQHGLFLRTDTPPPLRQLVRVKIDLPPHRKPFSAMGMPVHHVQRGDPHERVPGVGIQFYALDSDSQATWNEFLRYVRDHREDLEAEEVTLCEEPIRRSAPRRKAELQVRVQTLEELYTLYTRDVSRGGMFIATDVIHAVGVEMVVTIVHPDTAATFAVDAVVRHHEQDGVGVEFVDLTPERQQQLYEFIVASLPAEGDDLGVDVEFDESGG